MTESIDKQIAQLESELARLRNLKVSALRAQLAAIESQIRGDVSAPAAAAAPGKRGPGRKKKESWAPAAAGAVAAARPAKGGKRGRKPGPRISDEEVIEVILKFVREAGSEGTSARAIADSNNLFYPRVNGLIKKHKDKFKKSGAGKWTRYTIK